MPPYMYMNIYVMSNATLHYPALIINSYSFESKKPLALSLLYIYLL